MTTKEYLNQYRNALIRIGQLDDRIAVLSSKTTGAAIQYSPTPKGRVEIKNAERLLASLVDRKTQAEEKRIEAIILREQVASVIEQVKDPSLSQLLYDRYILLMEWQDIAEDIMYSDDYTRGRLHLRALNAAQEVIDNLPHNTTW